ncbi:MAG: sensor histidine kinase [Candidatus Sumerlaeaceae bacterium]
MTKRPIPERLRLTFQAKLFLAFAAGSLLAAFLLFSAGSYYINALQKRNVKAAVELAQEQARQLAREIIQLMREEKASSLSGGGIAERLRPLTQVILQQNRKIVWAGIFDPQTGVYVIEQTNDAEQTFRTRAVGDRSYKGQVPVDTKQHVDVIVRQSGTAQDGREIHQVIEHDGKQVGEIRLRLTDSVSYGRIEATSQQITRALAIQAILLFGVFLAVFWMVWVLVRRHMQVVTRNAELAQMAYVGTLASGLAHEIRNPLNAMSINLQLAEEDLAGNGDEAAKKSSVSELLRRVRSEIEQLNQTLTRFLEFALPTRESVTRFPLLGVIQELVDAHRPELEAKAITWTIDSPPLAETTIEGDRRLIHQALRNIFLNAIQAVANSVRKHVDITIRVGKEEICLTIADSGSGIPPEHLPHIFEAFYTTKKGGTGLGLAITHKIICEHGGNLEVTNQASRGVVVTVRLPRESQVM